MSQISKYIDAILKWVSNNEIGFDQLDRDDQPGTPKHDDPSKLRFGAWWLPRGKFYIGAIGMDVLRRTENGSITREEVGFIKLAVDEMVDNDGDPVPIVEIFLAPKVGQSQDSDMQRVLTISRKGAIFYIPVTGVAALPPEQKAPTKVTRFYTDGGKFCINWQDDQNNVRAVTYRCKPTTQYPNINPADESTWVAIGEQVFAKDSL